MPKFIEYVKVDARDGRPATEYPARHGPIDPIDGISWIWTDGDKNPPRYYGTVHANKNVKGVAGILRELDEEDWRSVQDMQRDRVIDMIDAAADQARSSDRSIGQYLDAEYRFVYDALAEYRADPDGKVPQAIRAHAESLGVTVAEAAEEIAEAAGRAEDLLLEVRKTRLDAKAAVRGADANANYNNVVQPFMGRLMDISAKYRQ